MSIASEITRITDNVADAYTAANAKGATMPVTQNSDNLASTVATIPTGITPTGTMYIISNGTYNVADKATANVQVPTTAPDHYIKFGISESGSKTGSDTPIDINGMTDATAFGFAYALYQSTTTTAFVNTASYENVLTERAFERCCKYNTHLTSLGLDIKTISGNATNAFSECCFGCTSLQSTGLHNLKQIMGSATYCFQKCFENCEGLTDIGLDNLEIVTCSYACEYMFDTCTALTSAEFPKLRQIIGSNGFSGLFIRCGNLAHVYFHVFDGLTSNQAAFGSSSGNMLSYVTGCTVHFHHSQQSVMSNWSAVTGGFGGTNTVVLFDLGINATVSIPSGYTVYANGVDITNESTFYFYQGDNEIVAISPDNTKVSITNFVATSSTTSFVFDPSQITYVERICSSNVAGATYSAKVHTSYIDVNVTADANDTIYYTPASYTMDIYGTASGYYADSVNTGMPDTPVSYTTLTFVPATTIIIDTTNFLSSITGDTTYASVDTTNNQLLYHYPTNAGWTGSVQIALNIPADTTKTKIVTRAYVSSEANYDYGYLALGTERANPQPTYQNVKNGIIANGTYLFKQAGTSNTWTNVTYETNDATQNVLSVGWAQDSSLQGTNTLYIKPITIVCFQ